MKRYIALLRFTDAGRKGIRNSTSRAGKFAQAARKAGGEIEGQFWTVGRFDGVLILRAASEQKALNLLTELAAAGNVSTESMEAFVADEFDAILGSS